MITTSPDFWNFVENVEALLKDWFDLRTDYPWQMAGTESYLREFQNLSSPSAAAERIYQELIDSCWCP